MGRGIPLPSRLEGLGERHKQSPSEELFYCFLRPCQFSAKIGIGSVNVAILPSVVDCHCKERKAGVCKFSPIRPPK